MKNNERQKILDTTKWIQSEREGSDLSGSMEYCEFCAAQFAGFKCAASQGEREESCYCAKAYNRMVKDARKNIY